MNTQKYADSQSEQNMKVIQARYTYYKEAEIDNFGDGRAYEHLANSLDDDAISNLSIPQEAIDNAEQAADLLERAQELVRQADALIENAYQMMSHEGPALF